MKKSAVGAATVLCAWGASRVVGSILGPGGAPGLLVAGLAVVLLGLGVRFAAGIPATGRRSALALLTAGIVTALSAGWSPLIRLGHALLAGGDLEAPSLLPLLLPLALPVGLPLLLMGLALGMLAGTPGKAAARRRLWPPVLVGAAVGAALAPVLESTPLEWRGPVLAAAGLLLLAGLVALRRPGSGGDAAPGSAEPGGAWVLLAGLGAGVGLLAVVRAWNILAASESGSDSLGLSLLLGGLAVGSLAPRAGTPARPAAFLALLVALLPWSGRLQEFLARLAPDGDPVAWPVQLAMAFLVPGLTGFALAALARAWHGDSEAPPAPPAGLLLAGAGVGWLAAGLALLPWFGWARTACFGALLVLAAALLRRRRGWVEAGLAGAAVLAVSALGPSSAQLLPSALRDGSTVLRVRDAPDASLALLALPGGARQQVVLDGRALGGAGLTDLANRALAGHLGPILREDLRAGLLISHGTQDAAVALESWGVDTVHRVPSPTLVGLEELSILAPVSPGGPIVEERDRRELPGLTPPSTEPSANGEPTGIPARAAAGLLLPSARDVIVVLPSDPTHPASRIYMSPEFYDAAAESLGERGVLIQRLDLGGLTPAQARDLLRRPADAFDNVLLWSFDRAVDGEVLVTASEAPLPLPWIPMLLENPETGRAPRPEPGRDRLRHDLARAGLGPWNSLVSGFIRPLRSDGEAFLLEPPPSTTADGTRGTEAVRAYLYGSQRVEWPLSKAVTYRHGRQYLAPLKVQTRLSGWREEGGSLEVLTQVLPLPQARHLGVYQELRPTFSMSSRDSEFTLESAPMVLPDENDVLAPLVEAGEETVVRTGQARVHGHPAPWHLKQVPSTPREQTFLAVWYCPFQGERYFLRYRTVEGTPNTPDPIAAWMEYNLQCVHPGDDALDGSW